MVIWIGLVFVLHLTSIRIMRMTINRITGHSDLCLEMHFSESLRKPLNAIMHAEFNNIVEINAERRIHVDYT